jgi:uncharacterized protein (DUF2252 family)
LKNEKSIVSLNDRTAALTRCRNLKMSQSAHAYVRGNTVDERMRAVNVVVRPAFVRELTPQDLKIEIEQLTADEATKLAGFLGGLSGKLTIGKWTETRAPSGDGDLRRSRSKSPDAPGWLWKNVVDLPVDHEKAYLEHGRKYALQKA